MKSFTYNGKRYTPVRKFEGLENNFFYVARKLRTNPDNTPKYYSWEKFNQKAREAGAGEIDIFEYNKRLVVPCDNRIDTFVE